MAKKKVVRKVESGGGSTSPKKSASAASKTPPKRKQSAKAKMASIKSDPVRLRKEASVVSRRLIEDIHVKHGDVAAAMLDEEWRTMIGIPFPSFCLEYLFDNSVLILEKQLNLSGLPKTKKSGLCFEIYRWFRRCGGLGTLFENESKMDPTWAASIIGYDEYGTLGKIETHSLDQWQTLLQHVVSHTKKCMVGTKQEPGIGTGVPYLAIVDSIMGKAALDTQNRVEKHGSITRAHPAEALALRHFMLSFPHRLRDWPFMVLYVNHLKPKTDDRGFTSDDRPGGHAGQFQTSFEVKVGKGGRDIYLANLEGSVMDLKMLFNSYGQTGRNIKVDVVWTYEDIPDPASGTPYRQKTVFNWHKGTTHLLLKQLADDPRGRAARKLLGLQIAKGNRCYATVLGVPKTAPITFGEMGRKIKQSSEAMAGLRRIFGIKQSKAFRYGMDFKEQKKDALLEGIGADDLYPELSEELDKDE